MGFRIVTNTAAINAHRTLSNNRRAMDKSFEKLSSGSRITRAGDDAAGLAISENLRAQVRGLRQAKRNAQDGISLIQVSEGGLNEITSILIRLRELAVQAASDTIGDTERKFTDREYQNLKEEIDRIANATEFNGTPLLNGRAGVLEIQVGTRNNPLLDRIMYNGEGANATLAALNLGGEAISTKLGAQTSLSVVDEALVTVNSIRSDLGAMQNRLESTINNLAVSDENLSAANSRIRDVDVAEESAEMTRNSILVQAGTSVMAQANQASQLALKLLG